MSTVVNFNPRMLKKVFVDNVLHVFFIITVYFTYSVCLFHCISHFLCVLTIICNVFLQCFLHFHRDNLFAVI